ncbi:unnamed protein product, partial [Urochloa humidicola]
VEELGCRRGAGPYAFVGAQIWGVVGQSWRHRTAASAPRPLQPQMRRTEQRHGGLVPNAARRYLQRGLVPDLLPRVARGGGGRIRAQPDAERQYSKAVGPKSHGACTAGERRSGQVL